MSDLKPGHYSAIHSHTLMYVFSLHGKLMLEWNNSGGRGATWVSKFGNQLIRKILVLTSAYVRPSVRPPIQTLGEGEGSPKTTQPGEAEYPFFLVAEANNVAAGSSNA